MIQRPTRKAPILALFLTLAMVFAACSTENASKSDSGANSADGKAQETTTLPDDPTEAPYIGHSIIFNGENNNLGAYDVDDNDAKQEVSTSKHDDDLTAYDYNGQVCFDPEHPRRFIMGEDKGQPAPNTEPSAEHPLQHWSIFDLEGDFPNFKTVKVANLTPTFQKTAGDNAENYGCGFLPDGRIVTTDVGNQGFGLPEDGQLIVWFPPFELDGTKFCKIDTKIATALGVAVDGADVYVASARPSTSGIWKYSGEWPTSDDAEGGCGRKDDTGAPLVDDGRIEAEIFVSNSDENGLVSPSGITASGHGTWYVSSIITGVISEIDTDGKFIRKILDPGDEKLTETTSFSGGTPMGMIVSADGSLYYCDIGVTLGPGGVNPGPNVPGSIRRIRFDDAGEPIMPPDTLDTDLGFPDGIGILQEQG